MTHTLRHTRLLEILISRGHVQASQVEAFVTEDEKTMGENLVKSRVITAEQLTEALAEQHNLQYVALEDYIVAPELFRLIPAAACYQQCILPYQ